MKKVINFKEKFNQFDELWSPKIISEMNNYEFKLVKVKDDFVWHKHDETDEVFIVIEGKLYIELLEETVEIEAGEMYVVPRGVKHRPFSKVLTKIMLVEKQGVVNTGDADSELTASNKKWI
ncbi:MAG: cupin [Gammaproteobacteria bacterium]|uniref:Cupin domain-containing protein n=1 Tax=SAR86 cluster bacterium TaxID=2030880 RepID=A0A520MXI9_9GAMM|nr:cupin [Gammaproteobacteria bacterium]RZO25933.1 MAG: cupin domain-containing protein [SAR86 cluster bacterium]|tara:strand:+ start:299 stop:661 length:363 start_codon:yes stop_codon:yes gene_type:complete